MNILARFVTRRLNSTSQQASALTKRRRFYKEVGVVEEKVADKQLFKVTLDGRILKTQGGKPLQIESEPLALAVAEEWASQEEHIAMGHMRLTGLAFTAQDNPLHTTKESITEKVLEYLDGDTVLYWNPDIERLYQSQQEHWHPVIESANRHLGTKLAPIEGMFDSAVSAADRARCGKWLLSQNHWALHAFQYAVESSKSVLLPMGITNFELSATQAVKCAMLEQKVQSETWGEVEWAHGIEEEELTARLSAASLFFYLNSNKFTSH